MNQGYEDNEDLGNREHYGDPHLHYEGYPEYSGYKDNACKWKASNQAPYDNYIPETPLYPNRCHVEYCHPGTWQMDAPMPMAQMAQMPLAMADTPVKSSTMHYAIIGAVVALIVLFVLRKRFMK